MLRRAAGDAAMRGRRRRLRTIGRFEAATPTPPAEAEAERAAAAAAQRDAADPAEWAARAASREARRISSTPSTA